MTSSRTPKQVRSQRRRDALLQAAVELVAEGGPQAVTHRAVAARAGLPSSTAGYFFASIDDLAAEALRAYTTVAVSEFLALGRNETTGRPLTIDQVIRAVAEHRADPQLALAQVAMYLEASRNPAMRAPVAEAVETFRQIGEVVLKRFGLPRAEVAATAMQALLDGFMLHSLAKPDDPPSPKLIAEAIDAMLAGYLLDTDERRSVKQRLHSPTAQSPAPRKARSAPKRRSAAVAVARPKQVKSKQ